MTMCVAPDRIEKSVLLVPSAIKNSPTYKSITMAFPMLMYRLTNKESWFIKCILPMAIKKEYLSESMFVTARCSIDNAKIKAVMPQNERVEQLQKYKGPVLVMAAENDCLFPAKDVIPQAKLAWEQSNCYILRDRGHINHLTDREKKMIVDLFKN